jgi:aldose 1-epimerase
MPRPPSGEQWSIGADGCEAVIVEVGGGLRTYHAAGRPILDGYGVDEMCVGGAGQVLAPWPNRIRDGRWSWHGTDYQLPLTEVAKHNAIHGLVRWRPWTKVSAAADSITVRCQIDPQPGYPFSVLVSTTWTISADGLRADHQATNTGPGPAPFGLGVHPYLLVPDVSPDDLVLRLPAETALRTDERGLPVGEYRVAESAVDFTVGRKIGSTQLDTAFTGGVSTARLSTQDGVGVELAMDESFHWIQVFTADTLPPPRRRRSVAVEPMTCRPDAFNSWRDVRVLEPDQSWHGSWTVRPLGG